MNRITRGKNDNQVRCRVLRHAWEELHVGSMRDYNESVPTYEQIRSDFSGQLVRICQCFRCGTRRIDWYPIGATFAEKGSRFKPFYTRMIYDEDYLVSGHRQEADDWHREYMHRHGVDVSSDGKIRRRRG